MPLICDIGIYISLSNIASNESNAGLTSTFIDFIELKSLLCIGVLSADTADSSW